MKAVIATEQGGTDVLKLTEVPTPQAQAGQVRVRIMASGLNPIDTKVRKARLPMTPREFPAILQTDFAGVVDQVGAGVSKFNVGDEVFGFAGGFSGPNGDVPGSLAEYAVYDAAFLARKPANLDFRAAAAIPLVASTAWKALFDKARVTPESRVLITGGAGGVGHMAVQMAAAAGAHVVAVTRSAESAEVAMASGARACVDLSRAAAADIVSTHTQGRGFDVIFDTVGGAALDAAFQMIKPAGDIVTVVGAASHNLAPLYLKGANLHMVLVLLPIMYGVGIERHAEIMEIITAMAEQGRLTPRLDSEPFGLADVAAAHAKYEAGQAKGKIVIDISS
ncbi:zinc-binding dehydrogenase [Rhizobium sp. BK376]|uniref:zinc-binding dehydrogenase n=1 Tax=Rhizobium sp. BK376 TaxID=2512149 RepID=UPI0010482C34|nr:zinc-binding dehydrogenase [Rhizobium sp. BK376]TCR72675.1 NADPH2:quinone reductase [Rhizobium sp. BK376]